MADTVQLGDPDQLRAYATKLAEVRRTLSGISARTHTSLNGALAPIDAQSYPRTTYSFPPDDIPLEYQRYAQGYSGVHLPESEGWTYLTSIVGDFEALTAAADALVASLTQAAGSADRTVAAQVHVATEAAVRLPETDAGGGAALAEAVASVPPPPAEPEADPRFVPRSDNRPR